MSRETDFINWFSPRTVQERRHISKLVKKMGYRTEAHSPLCYAFLLGKLTIDKFVTELDAAIAETELLHLTGDESDKILTACIHLLVTYLTSDQRNVLRQLCAFSGSFGDTSATALIMPDYEYVDGNPERYPSPIDESIGVLVEYGLLKEVSVPTDDFGEIILFAIPDTVRRYLNCKLSNPDDAPVVMARFAKVQLLLAESVVENIEIDALQRQYARVLFQDLRRALNFLDGIERTEHAYRCARIAQALGDADLAVTLRESAATHIAQDQATKVRSFIGYMRSTHLLADLKPVFPNKPQTPQDELDQILLTVAEQFVDLGILRRLSLSSYDFMLSVPAFVEQLTLSPIGEVNTPEKPLNAATESALIAIRRLRTIGRIPEIALLTFALGRAFVMKRMWVQANTQFENAARFAKSMNDERLKAAAFFELAPVRIYRGYEKQTHTLTLFMWAYSGFRGSGDYSNCCAACISDDVFTTLMHMRRATTSDRALKLLEASGLSQNPFHQNADDIIAIYQRLQSK